MSALPPNADTAVARRRVCFGPIADVTPVTTRPCCDARGSVVSGRICIDCGMMFIQFKIGWRAEDASAGRQRNVVQPEATRSIKSDPNVRRLEMKMSRRHATVGGLSLLA